MVHQHTPTPASGREGTAGGARGSSSSGSRAHAQQQGMRAAAEGKAAMLLLNHRWYGAPSSCQDGGRRGFAARAAAPMYDSDDETTDTAVVSALAMTDPAELSGRRSSRASRVGSSRGPILQPLLLHQDGAAQAAGMMVSAFAAAAASASGPGGSAHVSPLSTPATSLSSPLLQHSLTGVGAAAKPLPGPAFFTPAFGQGHAVVPGSNAALQRSLNKARSSTAAAAAATVAAAGSSGSSSSSSRSSTRQQQRSSTATANGAATQHQHQHQHRRVVPLSAAALKAAGMPCEIGGDLPEPSLQSHRASGANAAHIRPYHHLRMMQLHRQQQAQQQAQQQQQLCAQVQAASVWGWHVAGQAGTPVAT